MSTDEFLTEEEHAALMEVVAKRATGASDPNASKDGTLPYDWSSQNYAINNLVPVLETIQERFAHRLRVSLFELLRRDLTVAIHAIEKRSYADLSAALSAPCRVNVLGMSPLSGPALLIFDRELVFMIVDTFFGGAGRRYPSSSVRDFTAIETRFIQRLIQLSIACLEQAWEPFTRITCAQLNSENKPQFITALNPAELLIVGNVQVGRENIAGNLYLALPYSILEPIREALLNSLSKTHPNPSALLSERLCEGIKDSEVEVRCFLAELDLTLGELLALKVGDVIPADMPSSAVLQVEGIPMYGGHYGVAQGWRALKIEQTLGLPGARTANPAPAQDFAPFAAPT